MEAVLLYFAVISLLACYFAWQDLKTQTFNFFLSLAYFPLAVLGHWLFPFFSLKATLLSLAFSLIPVLATLGFFWLVRKQQALSPYDLIYTAGFVSAYSSLGFFLFVIASFVNALIALVYLLRKKGPTMPFLCGFAVASFVPYALLLK